MNNNATREQNKLNIVLAEDHKAVRELLAAALHQDIHIGHVAEANSGKEALEIAHRMHPDVLVTDLRLPDIDGIEIAGEIVNTLPATKVIIMSMYNDDVRVYNALYAGARGYMIKSSLDKLPEAIMKVSAGEIYLSPPLSLERIEKYRLRYNKPQLPANEIPPE